MTTPMGMLRRAWRSMSTLPLSTEPSEAADVEAPHTAGAHWALSDSAAPVHVIGDHGQVRLDGGRLSIAVDGGSAVSVRLDDVSALFLHGATGITTQAQHALLRHGAPILWHGFDGRLIGQTLGISSGPSDVREAQYRSASDPKSALQIGRAIVEAKLTNSRRLLLRRFGQGDLAVRQVGRQLVDVSTARTMDQLRGVEGAAARVYFGAWSRLIAKSRPHLAFTMRSRRPAANPANAALSYLYAVLQGRCAAAAVAVGLDPMVGFLHVRRPGRAALALDLMEPFRSVVVDTALITAFNNGEFPPEAFETPDDPQDGWRLSTRGRRTALTLLERRLAQPVGSPNGTPRGTYRDQVTRQARAMAIALRSNKPFAAFKAPG